MLSLSLAANDEDLATVTTVLIVRAAAESCSDADVTSSRGTVCRLPGGLDDVAAVLISVVDSIGACTDGDLDVAAVPGRGLASLQEKINRGPGARGAGANANVTTDARPP
jgi:hypothetical protein